LVYFNAIGDRILVLNSLKAANDLLDKRGQNYSDRVIPPSLEMYVHHFELLLSQAGLIGIRMDVGWDFSLHNYSPFLKKNRRIFHDYFNSEQISAYHPVFEQQALVYLRRLLADPRDFKELTK
jgi:hypothetical protein